MSDLDAPVQRIVADQLLIGRGDPVHDATVVIEDGHIAYAGASHDAPDTPGADVVECTTVMPGMWDAHVHAIGLPDLDLDRTVTRRREPQVLRAARDVGAALRMGFTTMREVGGFGVHLERVRREGLLHAPRTYAANAILSTTGGHGDIHDVPLDWVEQFGHDGGMLHVCDGVPEALKAVRTQLRMDAKVIKVCASGGVLSEVDHPIHQQFRHDELRAIVEEAAMADRVVAAHCHGAPGIEAAIEAGVHTIEHGSYLTEDLAAGMLENDMVLVPTRTVVDALVNHVFADGATGGATPRMVDKAHMIADRHARALGIAIDAGVTIAVGTDIGPSALGHPVSWGRNAKELELLVEAGMTELQAIEAATATGPTTLGLQAPMAGELREDWEADVLALATDPVADITVLQDPASIIGVWQGGTRVVTGRNGIPELAPLPLLD